MKCASTGTLTLAFPKPAGGLRATPASPAALTCSATWLLSLTSTARSPHIFSTACVFRRVARRLWRFAPTTPTFPTGCLSPDG